MNKVREVLFAIVGLISLSFMVFGPSALAITLGIIYSNWVGSAIFVIIWEGIGYYKHRYFKSNGYKVDGLNYKKT